MIGGDAAATWGKRWALVTDDAGGQSRSALATVRALGVAGHRVVVSVSEGRSIAAASRYCARRVELPVAGSAGYAVALKAEAAHPEYVSVFPSSDTALLALGSPSAQLVNKALLAALARRCGIATVPGQIFESGAALWASRGDLGFPIVVKPAVKMHGSHTPVARVDDKTALSSWTDVDAPLVVQPFIEAPMRATAGVLWDGRLRAVVHQQYRRTWPTPCGVASYAETTGPEPELEERLVALLETHQGVFQAQFLGERLIDVNPRVYGSLPLAIAAGANLPAIALSAATGDVCDLVRGRPGARYRWLEGDLRNIALSVRDRELSVPAAVAAVLPHSGTAHSVEALWDPLPVLARSRAIIRRMRT